MRNIDLKEIQDLWQLANQAILSNPADLASFLGFKNNYHHLEWYSVLADSNYRKIIVLAPRNHAKSTCFSVVYPLWEVVRNRNVRIVIVSNSAEQSEQFLRQITQVIEHNDAFRSVVGDLVPPLPEKWSSRAIIVDRTTIEKDPTISTVGAGGAILSRRADIIIADDILNKENTRTAEQRKKIKEWFNDILLPVLDPSYGRLVVVGTAFNLEDLYHDLLKDPTFDFKKVYKAIIKEPDNKEMWDKYREILLIDKQKANEFYLANKKEMLKGSEVLWEDRFDYKTLFDLKVSSGTRSFNLMYQNEAVSEETAVFKEEWIEACKDINRNLLFDYDASKLDLGQVVIAQGVDLAISEEARADWTVIMTVARTENNKYVVLNRLKGHWSPAETRKNIIGQAQRFKPSIILVEDNAYQQALVKDMQDETTLPIRGFTTTGEKYDEEIGINSLAVTVENGQWIFPANPNDPRTVDFYQELKEEMLKFPSGHTGDNLMALWFAFTALRSLKSGNVMRIKTSGMYRGINVKY